MRFQNFCTTCGAPLVRKGWWRRFRDSVCDDCWSKRGSGTIRRPIVLTLVIVAAAFGLGRYLRPAPPPLIIQRAANSPLSDTPVDLSALANKSKSKDDPSPQLTSVTVQSPDDAVYICGARTKKGTPCRRRVQAAGERCFQHKGMPAILPLDKLKIKP